MKNHTVSFIAVFVNGALDRAASLDLAKAALDTLESRLYVNQDIIAEMFSVYMLEPKQLALKQVPVSNVITVLWNRFVKEGKAPNVEDDPKGFDDCEKHFAEIVKNYFRENKDFFHLGEGRGAQHVIIRAIPGEVLRNADGSVKENQKKEAMQKYRCTKDEWNEVLTNRAVAEVKKKAKEAAKAKESGAVEEENEEEIEGSAISQPGKLLDQAAE